jgi:TPR repeat protein
MSRPRQLLPELSTISYNHAALSGPIYRTVNIDLHGLSEEKARATVLSYIHAAPEKSWDKIRFKIRFITGRGNHVNAKGMRGTIYKSFREWLQQVSNAPVKVEQFDGFYEVSFANAIYNPLDACFNQDIYNYLSSEIETIKTAAATKDFDMMLALALCYDKGIVVSKDYAAATSLYKEIADTRKDSLSQFEIGSRYFIGIGVRQNDLEAVRYLTLSAAQGYVMAEFLLGTIFHKGTDSVPIDLPKAHGYFIAAAGHRHAEAARKVGVFYYKGLGCICDSEMALKYWQEAAELGDSTAAFILVYAYESGKNVKHDKQKADHYLALSSELGDRDAQFLLGLKLFFGLRGVTHDRKTGMYWIQEAAKRLHTDALMFLYRIEMTAGNTLLAAEHVIAAAHAGDITAQYHITCMPLIKLQQTYAPNCDEEKSSAASPFTGKLQSEIKKLFLKQNNALIISTETIQEKCVAGYLMGDEHGAEEVKKGIALMKAMAEKNSTWAIGCLAGTYQEGHNNIIKPNPQLSYHYLLQGEKLNDPNCLLLLGRYWSQGLGTHLPLAQRVNMKKGLGFLERSRAQNYIPAYNELGNFYHTNQNLLLAVENYLKAVELSVAAPQSNQNDILPHAAANLGRIYFKGYEGIPRDQTKAFYYLDLAAVGGIVEAAMFLAEFYGKAIVTEKVIYYTNMAAKLGEPNAQLFMQVIRSNPKYIPFIDLYCQGQPEQGTTQEITFDQGYNLNHRPRIADTESVTQLKAKSALPFFAVKADDNVVDAVLQCKTTEDYSAIRVLQNNLHCHGRFFKNAKKKKYFVLENIDVVMSSARNI